MNYSVYYVSSKVVVFLTLLTFVLTGNHLTAEGVFVTMSLYNNVRLILTLFFPYGMSYLAEILISIRRLENFLLLEERSEDITVERCGSIENLWKRGSIGIKMKNLSAKWIPESDELTLEKVSMELKEGQLVAVIGAVGASKSSFLAAILGEMPCLSGELVVNGRLAYAAQEPWIFSGSIRDNILFGKEFDSLWYDRVLEACALERDLDLLPFGDSSLVGDRGISLSGGQKARVNLARAVYSDRDIYLLDDPLSAVDAEVGKHLFDKCIRGILAKKAVLLVTHQLQFLKPAKEIIILNKGKVEIQGSFYKLLQNGIDLAQWLKPVNTEEKTIVQPQLPIIRPNLRKSASDTGISSRLASLEMNLLSGCTSPVMELEDGQENVFSFSASITSSQGQDSRPNSAPLKSESDDLSPLLVPKMHIGYGAIGTDKERSQPMVVGEERSSGQITIGLYWKYLKAGSSYWSFLLLLITAILTQLFLTGSDYWLQFWTEIEESSEMVSNGNVSTVEIEDSSISSFYGLIFTDRNVQIGIYCGIIGTLFVVSLSRTITFTNMCLRSSISLHRMLFEGVLRTNMRFFEVNPVGRILNRFARDVGMIDEYLPLTLFDTWDIPLQGLGIFVIVGIMSPILLLPAVVLLFLFYKVRKYYLHTARSLKRLESITRSPVFTHLSSSFHGLVTIRALNVGNEFARDFDRLQDTHSSCWYLFLAASRWVAILLDWLSVLYISVVTYSFMASDLDGSQVGLAVSSALTLTGIFQWGVRQSAEAENHMVSVERVFEYSELPPEPPLESSPEKKPPPSWPWAGQIEMKNFYLRYGEEEPVLKNISLQIQPKEKVGVVGRTGAGKSSIISSLFRLVDPWKGCISIDGINILSIGLHDLRSKISIIPQDPVLFLGSLRRNLDPFSHFSDSQLWSALEDVHLKKSISELPTGLDTEISEGGSNFSVGERQLICLARAILRKNRVLVLDEATANVDPKTDALIQTTIRIKFEDCTVLTVAHRLHTVMDSDRILVLDAGEVVEFDAPYVLLQNDDGFLRKLTQQTGKATAETLTTIAKETYERNRLEREVC